MRTIRIRKLFRSRVPSHVGACAPTWLNTNSVCNMLDGGVTGFFRLVERRRLFGYKKVGEEFHGIIRNGVVETTQGCYNGGRYS